MTLINAGKCGCWPLVRSADYNSANDVIYLDHNATTPIAPELLEAMMPFLASERGNPSSSYKICAGH